MVDNGNARGASESATHAPLAGITVVDLTTQLPGPYATMLLRALGARVIKVEPPGGDLARTIDPGMFSRINADKELVELDLKQDKGRAVLHDLVRDADVFIEGFRPGVVDRLGADYTTLRALNNALVYCSLSGFGQTGPLSRLPSHDLNLLALAGSVSNGAAQGGMPTVDLASGSSAALAIVAALLPRPRQGVYLDMALLDSAVVWAMIKPMSAGESEPCYGIFATADGRQVAVSVMEDEVWSRLCDALGWTDWLADPKLRNYSSRRDAAQTIRQRLVEAVAALTLEQWLKLAARHELPVTAVLGPEETQIHPQVLQRALVVSSVLQTPLPHTLRVLLSQPAFPQEAAPDIVPAEVDGVR